MSALPPYNPDAAERRIFMLPVAGALDVLPELADRLGELTTCHTDSEGLVLALQDFFGPAVSVSLLGRDGAEWLDGQGDALFVAAPDRLDAALRRLIGAPPGTARVRFAAGALTEVQVVAGHAVVRHLNQGRAV